MIGRTLVTGGAGYLGMAVAAELLASGREVVVLDALLHGQHEQAADLRRDGAAVLEGDLRDDAVRRAALVDTGSVIHLAAIVGDPACARAPQLAHEVNVTATLQLFADAVVAGVERFVFASTCSNYGRTADPTTPIGEDGVLAPVSLYAEQKVAVERGLLERSNDGVGVSCLRLATLYGVAPRMRFDLTVNEFTRDLWADRVLEVFGEQFWRPYVHVGDAARAVRAVLDAPADRVSHEVFNVGDTRENYRKQDLVDLIRAQTARGKVSFVHKDEDPRDYRVSFEKISRVLGFEVTRRVPDGVGEIIAALEAGIFADAFHGRHRNVP